MALFLEKFPFMTERAVLIYNLINCDSFDVPKLFGAEFNLGIVGTAPKRKAPDLAFEILTRLKEIDKRYTLFIKGKQPWEYDWLWERPEERQYYKEFYSKVNQLEYANSVVFDPYGNDMADWFSKIGFLLSTSDHEGSHHAVAEGMASGAIPVIRNWVGADFLYPERFIFKTVDEAVKLILKCKTGENYPPLYDEVKKYARDNFDKPIILKKYDQLIYGLLNKKRV
jgi:glycosyltransferase involved in cell wall biosynthesis